MSRFLNAFYSAFSGAVNAATGVIGSAVSYIAPSIHSYFSPPPPPPEPEEVVRQVIPTKPPKKRREKRPAKQKPKIDNFELLAQPTIRAIKRKLQEIDVTGLHILSFAKYVIPYLVNDAQALYRIVFVNQFGDRTAYKTVSYGYMDTIRRGILEMNDGEEMENIDSDVLNFLALYNTAAQVILLREDDPIFYEKFDMRRQIRKNRELGALHKLNILKKRREGKSYNRRSGSFFEYVLDEEMVDQIPLMEHELTKYQIFTLRELRNHRDNVRGVCQPMMSRIHCLQHSLSEEIERDVFIPQECLQSDKTVATRNLSEIASANNIRINLKMDENHKSFNPSAEETAHLVIMFDHYFINDKTPVYLVNGEKLLVSHTRPKIAVKSLKQLRSWQLVEYLFENNYFIPMTYEDMLETDTQVVSGWNKRGEEIEVPLHDHVPKTTDNVYEFLGEAEMSRKYSEAYIELLAEEATEHFGDSFPLTFHPDSVPSKEYNKTRFMMGKTIRGEMSLFKFVVPYYRKKGFDVYDHTGALVLSDTDMLPYSRFFLDTETYNKPCEDPEHPTVSIVTPWQVCIRKVSSYSEGSWEDEILEEVIFEDMEDPIKLVEKSLDWITSRTKHSTVINDRTKADKSVRKCALVYTHNLGFDVNYFVRRNGYTSNMGRGKNTKGISMDHLDTKIEWRDTNAFASMTLANFGESFKLDVCKGHFPYVLTEPALRGIKFTVEECLEVMPKSTPREEFVEQIENSKAFTPEGKVDLIKLSRWYITRDVDVLHKAFETFRTLFRENEHLGIELDDYPTISSVAMDLCIRENCLKHVRSLRSFTRMFIKKCSTGGRVMSANNDIIKAVDSYVTVLDAVSLYPTAMYLLGGFLVGSPRKIPEGSTISSLSIYSGYFIKMRVKKVRLATDFPLFCVKDEKKGKLAFTNNVEGKIIYCNKIDIEGYTKYHAAVPDEDFEVLEGVYFESGRNDNIADLMRSWFDLRRKYKKDGNPIQNTFKLLLNSLYGKFSQKHYSVKERCFKEPAEAEKFRRTNMSSVITFTEVNTFSPGDNMFVVEYDSPKIEHSNMVHVGSEILSMSRLIMAEIFEICRILNVRVYYTDTDSLHIDVRRWGEICSKYSERNKGSIPLDGSDMGQFHLDIEPKIKKGEKLDPDYVISSDLAYYLGRKVYLLRYSYKILGEEKPRIGYKTALKGIPSSAILAKAEQSFGGSLEDLFEYMYKGNEVEFDMLADPDNPNVVRFKPQVKNKVMFVDSDSHRKVQFVPKSENENFSGEATERLLYRDGSLKKRIVVLSENNS